MWVCKSHVKEALKKLDAPHFYSAPEGIGMKCTICNKAAIANMYYAHKPLAYSKMAAKNNPVPARS